MNIDFIPKEDDTLICATKTGDPTGRAYVQLKDLETAERAQQLLDKKYVGTRKVRVTLSSSQEASAETDMYF
jgi:hypothetical protein